MRQKSLIKEASPCDTDYTDRGIQTIADAKAKGRVVCQNFLQCQKRNVTEEIQCCRQVAQQMAGYILDHKESFNEAVKNEREEYLQYGPEGKFWVFRDNNWQVVEGKKNVIDDIVEFAKVIIDLQPGERRPFTQDGMKKPEFGPGDAMHNAMLDLDDVYGEVGQKNPLR